MFECPSFKPTPPRTRRERAQNSYPWRALLYIGAQKYRENTQFQHVEIWSGSIRFNWYKHATYSSSPRKKEIKRCSERIKEKMMRITLRKVFINTTTTSTANDIKLLDFTNKHQNLQIEQDVNECLTYLEETGTHTCHYKDSMITWKDLWSA